MTNEETWFQSKLGAMASALFFLISWALSTGLQPHMTTYVFVAYLGIGGVSSSSPSHSTSYLTFNLERLPPVPLSLPSVHRRLTTSYSQSHSSL
jgi:hypothetical protein